MLNINFWNIAFTIIHICLLYTSPVPEEVKKSIYDILENRNANFVHCYMPNAGYPEVREKVAANLNKKYDSSFTKEDIIMTVGAAGGINCCLLYTSRCV